MPCERAAASSAVGENVLAFFAEDDRGAGVLAGGQLAGGGDDGVLQMGVEDEAIVVGGFGVGEFFAELREVGGAEVEGDIDEGLAGE